MMQDFQLWALLVQRRAGNARHDSAVWGYARAADSLGVDILQNCEVTGVKRSQNNIESLETSRGTIKAKSGFCCCRTYFCFMANGWTWKFTY